jgi:hypothetical protein
MSPKEIVDRAAAAAQVDQPIVEESKPIESAKETVRTEAPVKTPKPRSRKLKTPEAKITDIVRFKAQLEEYRRMFDRPIITDSARASVLNKLVAILQTVIKSGERNVIEELFQFFVKERKGCLSEEVVFRGISKLGDSTRMRIEVLYAAMCVAVRNRTAKVKTRINLDRVREILKNEKIVAYLASKG